MSPMMDDDLVLCIQSLDWPHVAEGWRTRESKWPGASVKEEISEMGCHLVPVHHAASKSPEIEWRLSFSEAEKELALKMSATVKSAYLLVKIVMKSLSLKEYGISSYFLKTTLLWMCEKDAHLQDISYDQIGIVFMQIFDALIENLNNGKIEHFFVPENNLLSCTPRKNIDKAVDLLQVARKDPLKLLMEFTQSFKFYGFYELPNFSIFDPIVELLRSNDMGKMVESKISVTKALVEFNLTWLEKTRPMKGFYVIGEIVFFTMSFLARTLVKEGEPATKGLEYVNQRIKSVNEENSMTFKRHFMEDLMYSDDT
ncbi:cyclic GMP-AMP synthase-like receptor 1 isoform X2 [Clytia hemisphaerica]